MQTEEGGQQGCSVNGVSRDEAQWVSPGRVKGELEEGQGCQRAGGGGVGKGSGFRMPLLTLRLPSGLRHRK